MKPDEIKNKTILLSALNWGMGHVSRCIPIIHQLIKQNNKLIIACSKKQEKIYKNYFPHLIYIEHADFPFKFKGNGNFERDLTFNFIQLYKRFKLEKKEVEKITSIYEVDIIISDHRYSFISKNCYSIFLTHQINLPVSWYMKWIDRIHKKLISQFNFVWLLDSSDSKYAGKLSKNKTLKKCEYIGIKSRFSLYPKEEKTIPIVVIISGPEPYSELFFNSQLKIAQTKIYKTVFIVPKRYTLENESEIIEIIESNDWKQIDSIIIKAQKIISRAGYSTIMDIAFLETNSELIPTPGQKEQEYLMKT
jgi:UDP-N-acetylglucosamine:LPS N-acetylglucosamine transferase